VYRNKYLKIKDTSKEWLRIGGGVFVFYFFPHVKWGVNYFSVPRLWFSLQHNPRWLEIYHLGSVRHCNSTLFLKKKLASSYFLVFLNRFYILILKINFKKLKNIFYFNTFSSKKQFILPIRILVHHRLVKTIYFLFFIFYPFKFQMYPIPYLNSYTETK